MGLTHLYSMVHNFTGPTFFITISPSEVNHPLALRLVIPGAPNASLNGSWVEEMPGLKKRAHLLSRNPVAAARVFDMIVKSFASIMVGIPINQTKKVTMLKLNRGLFGRILAMYGVVEAQGRGGIHLHAILMTLFRAEIIQQWAHEQNVHS